MKATFVGFLSIVGVIGLAVGWLTFVITHVNSSVAPLIGMGVPLIVGIIAVFSKPLGEQILGKVGK